MGKSVFSGLILSVATVSTAIAQIPPGFEVVEVRSADVFHQAPRINNCGEIVFYTGTESEDAEIFLYDNGSLVQITDDALWDWYPDINDAGVIAWGRSPEQSVGEILILQDGELTLLAHGSPPVVNNLVHVAWDVLDAQTCAFEGDVFFYDGVSVQQITDNGLSNQSVALNDNDQMVWTRKDYCVPGSWVSDIMYFSDGVITELPSVATQPQGAQINNLGLVAWGGPEGIELWENGSTVPFTAPGEYDQTGKIPALNDVGDIAFNRKLDSFSYWQVWLYRDAMFYQITDSSKYHAGLPDINDTGEIAWRWNYEALHPGGVRLLRRIRDGEADFDGQVDLDDFAVLRGCLTGPLDTDRLCDCRFLDIDHDRDVDLADFAAFQNLFTGEG